VSKKYGVYMNITRLGRHKVRVIGSFGGGQVITECEPRAVDEIAQLVALECKKSGRCPHCGRGAA
jgi:hypothetical protein